MADVAPVTAEEYPRLLPLVAAYQRFYGVAEPDEAQNEEFFRRFLAPSDDGLLLGAWVERELAGYACLYWTFSSVSAADVVLLNDLFVHESFRGAGIGRGLIDAALDVARGRGASVVRWWTALDNRRAQRLYESTPAQRSAWFEYEIAVVADEESARDEIAVEPAAEPPREERSNLDVIRDFLEPLNGVAVDRAEAWQGAGTAALQRFLDSCDENVEWDASHLEIPGAAGVYTGKEGVIAFWRAWMAPWDDYRYDAQNYEQVGDAVLVDVTASGTTRGAQVHGLAQTQLYEFRDGRVVRWTGFPDRAQALARAAGSP
jgi:GNAT superfamily N-acetyltransferase